MSYKLSSTNHVQHIESGAWIPARFENGAAVILDAHSPFAKEFVAWLALGNVPLPVPTPHPNVAVKAALAGIDRLTMLGVRGLREFILVQAQLDDHLILDGTTPIPAAPISNNIGISNIRQLEQAAAALRAQLVPE